MNKEINGREKTHRNINKGKETTKTGNKKKSSGLLFGDVRLQCLFSKSGQLFQEWAQENTAGRGVDNYMPGLRTARSKSFRKEAAHRKVPTKIPFLCSAPATTRARTGSSRPAHEATRHRVLPPSTADVRGRGQPSGAAVDPAVARRGGSQSAPAASAGRPLNSARQLPAVWRVHSAMQYVCQRCGTKEQPFCD